MPPPSPLTDNNTDVRLRENDPKYGDDSREAITSRFYQTVTVSDVRMADSDRTETNLAFFSNKISSAAATAIGCSSFDKNTPERTSKMYVYVYVHVKLYKIVWNPNFGCFIMEKH